MRDLPKPELDYRILPEPQLQIVPVTPTAVTDRGRWHPGLDMVIPDAPGKKPVLH